MSQEELAALAHDPFVARELDEALSPFIELLDPAEVEWIRGQLIEQIVEDGALTRALAAAYPREVDESGERVKAWLNTTIRPDDAKSGSGG